MDVLRIHQDELQDDSAFEIASNIKYDGYELGLALIVYKNIFNKKANRQEQESLRIQNWRISYINLENFKSLKYTCLIKVTLGVLILQK